MQAGHEAEHSPRSSAHDKEICGVVYTFFRGSNLPTELDRLQSVNNYIFLNLHFSPVLTLIQCT
jgi:hypothetical protein